MIYKQLIFLIVLAIPFLSFSQIQFREVIINADTLGCLDARGAALLANRIAELQQSENMLPLVTQGLEKCNALSATRAQKIATLEQQQTEGKELILHQKSIILVQKQQIAADKVVIGSLEKESKKYKRRNKTSLILGGIVAGVLTGVIIAVAL